jgi:hypothetical protein
LAENLTGEGKGDHEIRYLPSEQLCLTRPTSFSPRLELSATPRRLVCTVRDAEYAHHLYRRIPSSFAILCMRRLPEMMRRIWFALGDPCCTTYTVVDFIIRLHVSVRCVHCRRRVHCRTTSCCIFSSYIPGISLPGDRPARSSKVTTATAIARTLPCCFQNQQDGFQV